MLIRKVYKTKASDQLLVSIPKDSGIESGDYVSIKKVEEKEGGKDDSG